MMASLGLTKPDGSLDLTKLATLTMLTGAAGTGLGGILQALTGRGQTATSRTTIPPASAAEMAIQLQNLEGLQKGQQFAFGGPGGGGGVAGQLQSQAPFQNQATMTGMNSLMGMQQTNPFLQGMGGPTPMASMTPGQPPQAQPGSAQTSTMTLSAQPPPQGATMQHAMGERQRLMGSGMAPQAAYSAMQQAGWR